MFIRVYLAHGSPKIQIAKLVGRANGHLRLASLARGLCRWVRRKDLIEKARPPCCAIRSGFRVEGQVPQVISQPEKNRLRIKMLCIGPQHPPL